MNQKLLLAVGAALALCACQPPSDSVWPEEGASALATDKVEEAPQAPSESPITGRVDEPASDPGQPVMGLLGRPDGPILPTMAEDLVQVAVDLANEELDAQGYDIRAEPVLTYQGTVEEVSFYARKPDTLGWTPGRVIFVGPGDLCESPAGYEGRLLVWVLAHEVLHTVGFEHGDEMMGLTDRLGERCNAYCGVEPEEEDVPDPGPYVEPAADCAPVTRHCFKPDPTGGFTCISDADEGVEICGNGIDDDCDGYTDEDLGTNLISDATCFPVSD